MRFIHHVLISMSSLFARMLITKVRNCKVENVDALIKKLKHENVVIKDALIFKRYFI